VFSTGYESSAGDKPGIQTEFWPPLGGSAQCLKSLLGPPPRHAGLVVNEGSAAGADAPNARAAGRARRARHALVHVRGGPGRRCSWFAATRACVIPSGAHESERADETGRKCERPGGHGVPATLPCTWRGDRRRRSCSSPPPRLDGPAPCGACALARLRECDAARRSAGRAVGVMRARPRGCAEPARLPCTRKGGPRRRCSCNSLPPVLTAPRPGAVQLLRDDAAATRARGRAITARPPDCRARARGVARAALSLRCRSRVAPARRRSQAYPRVGDRASKEIVKHKR
jgi:hypothetical protein